MKRTYTTPTTAAIVCALTKAPLAASGDKDWNISDKEVDEQGAKEHGDLWGSDWTQPEPSSDEP